MLDNIIPFVHKTLAEHIRVGDTVVDATAGNGHDTLFLAQCVGEGGRVWAFDVQQSALDATARRLSEHGMRGRVHLVHSGHEHMAAYVAGRVRAVLFNFGYLPGGDKSRTTRTDTSLAALQAALSLLDTGGLAAAVLYPGHPEGAREAAAIVDWAQTLPQNKTAVLRYSFINRIHQPPFALILEKRV